MKVYPFIPILAIALLIPSFAEAKHSKRKRQRHYTEHIRHHQPPFWAPAHGIRVTHLRGHDRRGYHYHDHRLRNRNRGFDHRYDHSRGRTYRRDRRGVSIGGVIVIRF